MDSTESHQVRLIELADRVARVGLAVPGGLGPHVIVGQEAEYLRRFDAAYRWLA